MYERIAAYQTRNQRSIMHEIPGKLSHARRPSPNNINNKLGRGLLIGRAEQQQSRSPKHKIRRRQT